jgi:hypothetical protein
MLALLAVAGVLIGASVLAGLELFSASAETVHIPQSTSNNWAGYMVEGDKFSSVSGSWVVPSANNSTTNSTNNSGQGYSAFWVGLGGSSSKSSSLEQIGTESDYVAGQARYYAWYELVPSAAARLKLTIGPGDHISANVSVSGTSVTVSLSDLTTGKSATKTLNMRRPDTSSAEWIAEAPSVVAQGGSYQILPLADFGEVTFTAASATAGGHTGSIADSQWKAQKVQLASSSGGFSGPLSGFPGPAPGDPASAGASGEATSSALTSGGSSFSVSWRSSSSTAGQSRFGRFLP